MNGNGSASLLREEIERFLLRKFDIEVDPRLPADCFFPWHDVLHFLGVVRHEVLIAFRFPHLIAQG